MYKVYKSWAHSCTQFLKKRKREPIAKFVLSMRGNNRTVATAKLSGNANEMTMAGIAIDDMWSLNGSTNVFLDSMEVLELASKTDISKITCGDIMATAFTTQVKTRLGTTLKISKPIAVSLPAPCGLLPFLACWTHDADDGLHLSLVFSPVGGCPTGSMAWTQYRNVAKGTEFVPFGPAPEPIKPDIDASKDIPMATKIAVFCLLAHGSGLIRDGLPSRMRIKKRKNEECFTIAIGDSDGCISPHWRNPHFRRYPLRPDGTRRDGIVFVSGCVVGAELDNKTLEQARSA